MRQNQGASCACLSARPPFATFHTKLKQRWLQLQAKHSRRLSRCHHGLVIWYKTHTPNAATPTHRKQMYKSNPNHTMDHLHRKSTDLSCKHLRSGKRMQAEGQNLDIVLVKPPTGDFSCRIITKVYCNLQPTLVFADCLH